MARQRVSYSEAEDKSIRLGLFLVCCGVLALFLLPCLPHLETSPSNCTLVSVSRLVEAHECVFTCGVACSGRSLYPCLQVFVNNSQSEGGVALLHFDEQQLLSDPKCSYVPPCERDDQKNEASVLWWEQYFNERSGQTFTCYFNQQRRPDDVLWQRSHDPSILLHCVLWPVVSLLLGSLIVLLTICARSLAVRAEALQKRKCSYEGGMACHHHGDQAPVTTLLEPQLSGGGRDLLLFSVPTRRRDH